MDNYVVINGCPICGKQSLSASNHYCRDHTHSDDTDKYHIDYDGVICTAVNWETKEFYFTFKGKEYKYKQQYDISCNADTDHIKCVIEEFKEKVKEYNHQYNLTHSKEKITKFKEKYANDITFKLGSVFSSNIYNTITANKAGQHWEDLVPYTLQQLKEHLESQFNENMNWDNYGSYWEIDHIIPQNTFNFTTYTDHDFQICWSLANLRPLEKIANRSRPKDGSDISEELKIAIYNNYRKE